MNPPKVCFAHHHMTPGEYGLYTHLREVSSRYGYHYKFDDRTISGRFASKRGNSKDTVNRLRQSLFKLGFIEWVNQGEKSRTAGGKYQSQVGRILSHKEWAARHPGRCIETALDITLDPSENALSPVSNSPSHLSQVANAQSHFEPDQSQIDPSPVSNSRSHLSHQRDIRGIYKPDGVSQSLRGMASAQNIEAPPPSDSAIRQSHYEAPVSAARQVENSPVSSVIQVETGGELPPGYELRDDGNVYSGSGVRVAPNVLALLLEQEQAQ